MLITLAAGLTVALWLVQLALLFKVARAVVPTSSLPPATRAAWPKLSIIVPARDEASGIKAALQSKLASSYPSLEVVAIDDRSTDRTGALIDQAAANDPRITAAHVTELPPGWLGKLNAMQRGLEHASGEWILFSDADVHVEPGVLERLIAWAEAGSVDLVAVFPRMHPTNPLIDGCLAVVMRVMALGSRTWLANDDRSPVGLGVGAFNLVRKRVLDETRAVHQLRMEVADDVALGALLKHYGHRVRFLAGRGEVHLTWLPDLSAVAKSAFKAGHMFGFSLLTPLVAAAVPMTLELVIPVLALFAGGAAALLGGLSLALAVLVNWLLLRHFDGPRVGALMWPFGHVYGALLTLGAGFTAWRHQGVFWRGTFYPRPVLEKGRRLSIGTVKVLTEMLD